MTDALILGLMIWIQVSKRQFYVLLSLVTCLSLNRNIIIYLRNHLTHTVKNLLQTLNNVKSIQIFVVIQKFNIIHIMCENLKSNTLGIMQTTAYLIWKGQNRKSQKLEFMLKSAFQWGNFNFICHAEQWKASFCNKKCMKFTVN